MGNAVVAHVEHVQLEGHMPGAARMYMAAPG